MQVIIALIIGILAGFLIAAFLFRRKPVVGTLRADTSDPQDGPYLFLELTESIADIVNSRQVTLDVKLENYISQK